MSEKLLRQNIIDELDFEPSIEATNIGVAVKGDVVTLTGHVPTYAQKIKAEEVARNIRGVRAIAQEIEVRPPAMCSTGDDAIAERALALLDWDVDIPRDALQVMVAHGWVNLDRRGRMAIPAPRSRKQYSQAEWRARRHESHHAKASGPDVRRSNVRHQKADRGCAQAQCANRSRQYLCRRAAWQGHAWKARLRPGKSATRSRRPPGRRRACAPSRIASGSVDPCAPPFSRTQVGLPDLRLF